MEIYDLNVNFLKTYYEKLFTLKLLMRFLEKENTINQVYEPIHLFADFQGDSIKHAL